MIKYIHCYTKSVPLGFSGNYEYIKCCKLGDMYTKNRVNGNVSIALVKCDTYRYDVCKGYMLLSIKEVRAKKRAEFEEAFNKRCRWIHERIQLWVNSVFNRK